MATAWEWLHGGGPTDNVFTSQALLYLLRDGGYSESADGGRLFEYSVEYTTNTTFRSYSELSVLDTSRIDCFDAARFEQKIYAGTIVFSDLEQLRNAVANRKMDVVKGKLKNATNSAMEGLDGMLYGDGSGNSNLDMDGLAKHISSTPTVGVVGGINAATWSFWRNKQTAATNTATAFDNLEAAMRSIYNQCSLGGTEKIPTGMVTDRNSFQGYESLLVDIERLVKDSGGESEADLGWLNEAIQFKGCPLVYDEQCPAATLYAINKAFLKLTTLKGAWLKNKEPVEPANQLAIIHRVMTVGNLCVSARRHLGVITAIS